jgi:hypothetical protein
LTKWVTLKLDQGNVINLTINTGVSTYSGTGSLVGYKELTLSHTENHRGSQRNNLCRDAQFGRLYYFERSTECTEKP